MYCAYSRTNTPVTYIAMLLYKFEFSSFASKVKTPLPTRVSHTAHGARLPSPHTTDAPQNHCGFLYTVCFVSRPQSKAVLHQDSAFTCHQHHGRHIAG